MRYNIAALLADSARLRMDTVSAFRQHVARQHRSDLRTLEQRAERADYEELGALSDDSWVLDEIAELADELAIVALYRVVELTTQKILRQRYDAKAAKKLYRFDRMKDGLMRDRDLNLNIQAIPRFRYVDELRALNNAIKHSGRVSPELARYPGWTEGKKLSRVARAYDRFTQADRIPTYLQHLAQRIIPQEVAVA